MKKIMGMLLALVLLAACGTAAPASSTAAPVEQSQATEASAPQSEAEESQEEAAWPRTIEDAAGHTVVLEAKPQRIAILHSLYLEYFFALEEPPAASAGSTVGDAMRALETWETLKPYVGTAEIIDLGSARQINLEAVLAAEPDVIVTFKTHGGLEEIYDQLVQIAPVVLVDYNTSWQEQTLACAKIVGKETFAQQLIAETEAVVASTKELLNANSEKTFAIFRTDAGKAFVTRGDKNYYDTFGLTMPEGFPEQYETVSLEAVAQMNPDYIVFQDFVDVSQAFVETQQASSVWNALDAVKNGNIYYFDDSLNTFGPLSVRLTAQKLTDIYSK